MQDRTKGIIFMITASLFFALMSSAVKWTGDLPLMQKVFFRNLISFFVALSILIKRKESLVGNNIPFLFLRSILGFLGVVLNFFAISHLLLADASILQNTNPFFVILFSFLFLKEPIKKIQIPALILAFLGAVFVIKPAFNYRILPSLMGLAAGMFAGSAYVTVRFLRNTDSPRIIVLYFSGISILLSLPFLFTGQYIPPTFTQWIGLIGVGIFATIAQLCITYAYGFAPAGELSIYNYTQIFFTLLLGMLLWFEIPDFLSILGGLLIIMAGYINYRFIGKETKTRSQ